MDRSITIKNGIRNEAEIYECFSRSMQTSRELLQLYSNGQIHFTLDCEISIEEIESCSDLIWERSRCPAQALFASGHRGIRVMLNARINNDLISSSGGTKNTKIELREVLRPPNTPNRHLNTAMEQRAIEHARSNDSTLPHGSLLPCSLFIPLGSLPGRPSCSVSRPA